MNITFIIVLAIILSIALGYLSKINIGLYAISFAYLIGAYLMNLKVNDIILMWPLKIFFILFSITLFYNFAIINGTLEKISLHAMYRCNKYPGLLPIVMYLLAIALAAMGAGFYAVLAFLAPMSLMLAEKSGMNPVLGALAVAYGAITGSNFMTSVGGIIIKELIAKAGYAEQAFTYTFYVFITTLLVCGSLFIGAYIIFKGYRIKETIIEKPEALTREQKINLYLIAAMIVIILLPSIIYNFAPQIAFVKFINSKMDVGFAAIIMSILAFIFKLGDEKQVINKIPWGTILMICGIGILIEIAVKAGTIKLLAGWVGTNIPFYLVPLSVILIGGCMSFFSSTYGVVLPTLYPLVFGLAQISGASPALLFSLIQLGAISTGVSPFSSGGSLILASAPNDDVRKELFPKLLFILPLLMLLVTSIFAYLYLLFT